MSQVLPSLYRFWQIWPFDLHHFFFYHKATVSLYESGSKRKELVFNAVGTNQESWFSVGKLTSSSWPNIKTEPQNHFSIKGHCNDVGNCRSFIINRHYDTCDRDAGWLMWGGMLCSWENTPSNKNGFLYSKVSTYTEWSNSGKPFIHLAWPVVLN